MRVAVTAFRINHSPLPLIGLTESQDPRVSKSDVTVNTTPAQA